MSFDASKVDWAKVQSSGTAIAIELAKGTPTPLDDMIAPFAGAVIAEAVSQFLKPRVMQSANVIEDARPAIAAAGLSVDSVPPWLWAVIYQIGQAALQKILEKLKPA